MSGTFDRAILGRLGEASAAEIETARAQIRQDMATYQGQPASTETVSALNELVSAAQALNAERDTRAALAADRATHLASLADLTADPDEPDEAATETEETATEADTATVTVEQPGIAAQEAVNATHEDPEPQEGATTEGGTTGDTQEGETTVTASAGRRVGGVNKTTTAGRTLPTVTVGAFAATGIPNVEAGTRLTRESLATAFADVANATRRIGGNRAQRYTVATVRTEYPESRRLTRANAFANMARVEEVVDEARGVRAADNALTAAGLCAPLETLYDVRVIGDPDRPIRDALVRFGAERGGIQYRPAFDGVTQTGGTGVWTVANDEADPLVPKTCLEIDCPGIVTAEIEAIYQCLTFSNMSSRFDPEWMAAVERAQEIAHARFAENRLYTQLLAGSKTLYTTQLLGAVRDILATLDKVIAYYRNVHRLADETPLRWIAPLWAKYLMRADMVRQMVGDGMQVLSVTDAQINSWFTDRNVNVTFHLDGVDPADITVPDPDVVVPAQFYTNALTGTLVPGFPNMVSSLLFAEGDWLMLDGGTMDMGIVRDSELNSLNQFQTFSESFEFPAFRGIESLHVAIAANPTGQSAATVSTASAAD